MTKPTKGPRLGNSPAHQRLILSNLATQLFQNDSIQTTFTRAKRVRPLVEKLITLAKEGSIHSRRQVVKIIHNKSVVHKLFTEIAETFRNTSGGYVRITKTGFRLGDHAELAQIELLQTPKSTAGGEPKRAEPTEENGKPEVETVAEVADGEDGQDAAQSEETEVTSDETSAESDSSPAASDSEARPSPDHKPAQGEN